MQVSILSRQIILLGLCLGALALTGEPTDAIVPEADNRLVLLENTPEVQFIEQRERAEAKAEMLEAVKQMIDVDKMVKKQKADARVLVKYYQRRIRNGKSRLKSAKKAKRAHYKSIRGMVKRGKCHFGNKLKPSMKSWTKNSYCKQLERCDFVKGEEMLQVDEMKPHNSIEEEMMLEEGRRRRRKSKRAARKQKRQSKRAARKQKRAAKKAKRKEKRAAKKAKRKAKKAAKCAKKPRCLRRKAKRNCREKARDLYKKVRSEVKDYKKQLRKAKFQLKVLPKIVLMLKPSLLSAMSQMDMGDGAEGGFRACKADGVKKCVPVDKIGAPDLLLNFARVNLHATLWPILYKLFEKIQDTIWAVVDPIYESAKTSLITSVGSIPIVGGALAGVVNAVCTIIYKIVKMGVGTALGMVRKALQKAIVSGVMMALTPVVKGMFRTGKKPGTFVKRRSFNAKRLERRANSAAKRESKEEERVAQKEANAEKRKARRQQRKAEKDLMAEGKEVEAEEKAEDAEDEAEDKADEAGDDDDEE